MTSPLRQELQKLAAEIPAFRPLVVSLKTAARKVAVKAPAGFEIEEIKIAGQKAYLLKKGAQKVGYVVPGRKTRTTTTPIKVNKGVGTSRKMIAVFYPKGFQIPEDQTGAKPAHETHKGTLADALAYLAKNAGKQASIRRTALRDATVRSFMLVLTGKLTKYDVQVSRREMKRGIANIYRLGHLLEAAEKVEADMKRYMDRDDPKAMNALRKSLAKRFTEGFPPIKAVLKTIDAWETGGKIPKYGRNQQAMVRIKKASLPPLRQVLSIIGDVVAAMERLHATGKSTTPPATDLYDFVDLSHDTFGSNLIEPSDAFHGFMKIKSGARYVRQAGNSYAGGIKEILRGIQLAKAGDWSEEVKASTKTGIFKRRLKELQSY